ncbi:hypothetical protein KAR91_01730, partial [Candidatus Pacearchaeota archaeon]|nr:hypothetical protein [Candidatus Pacearchaeota archaeon]
MSSSTSPTRVAIVQPIIAPTREPWLRELSKNSTFEITVFSLRKSLKHRPGWKAQQANEYKIVDVPSLLIKTKWKFSASIKPDMGGRII